MDPLIITPDGNLLNYTNAEMIVNICLALVAGVVLSFVYRLTHKGLSYSQSFSQTIVFVAVIVAIVMMVIGGSLARAFALVGALSIIRFRTVLKDTKDMSYVFGALALGMASGTSNYFLTVIGGLAICALAFVIRWTNFGAVYKSEFILRFRLANKEKNSTYQDVITKLCKRSNLLHLEPAGDNQTTSMTFDVALNDDVSESDLTQAISAIEEVSEVVLIASKNDIDY